MKAPAEHPPSPASAPLYWAWWGWEPLDHYRRAGGVVGAVDTSAPWLAQWYERLHTEELARLMAGLGVNLAVTHFFKGFGLVRERAEQQRTAALVRFAHRHGIKVLGYCQSRSLYHETFLAEEPRAEEWVQRDEKGKLRTWGGAYYRWAPCIHCREFRDYMKRAIRAGLEEAGLDGLHFDNNYAQPCYCARCEKSFREWLAKHNPSPRERFNLASFDHVRLPPTESSPGRIVDPIVQEWVRWRCESLAEYQGDLAAFARSVKPGVILLGNPAHPRDPNGAYARSVWAPLLGRQLDLMFAENGNFPGVEDDVLISQARAYKQSDAVGYRVVSTVWRRGRETGLSLPDTAEDVGLQIAEAAANGGLPGTNWALRPLGEGNRMRVERPELQDALKKYLGFVRANEKLLAGARPARDVAVLQTFASMVFDNREATALVHGVEETLIRGGFAWNTIFGEQIGRLGEFGELIVAGQTHLSDCECLAIREFAQRGGGLVLVGENGRFDENGRERAQSGLAGLEGPNIARLDAAAARVAVQSAHGLRGPLPKKWTGVAKAIARIGAKSFSARLEGTDTVALSAFELPHGALAVHLVNYAVPKAAAGARLLLGPRRAGANRVRWLDADDTGQSLAPAGGAVKLPPIRMYAVAVIE
jgi:hypothetical protein